VRRRLAVPLLVPLLLLAGCDDADGGIDVHAVQDAEPPARDAVLEDAEWPETAAWIRREAEDGRPVLINILASWCRPCERELPLLIEAHEANPDIAFLGVDHQDQRDNAEAFVEEQGITFPTVFDIGGDVAYSIGGRGMPTTAVFDEDGRMVAMHTGELTASSLEDLLDQVR
jgi:thiol-disulfide isomerase/thioredoxin